MTVGCVYKQLVVSGLQILFCVNWFLVNCRNSLPLFFQTYQGSYSWGGGRMGIVEMKEMEERERKHTYQKKITWKAYLKYTYLDFPVGIIREVGVVF